VVFSILITGQIYKVFNSGKKYLLLCTFLYHRIKSAPGKDLPGLFFLNKLFSLVMSAEIQAGSVFYVKCPEIEA
jgi:hypothetical protein